MQERLPRRGFTVIELSIVLVVIGLVAGGVLVGIDLVKAAANRRTVAQVQGVQTAVRAFQERYGALPGDLPNASSFWPNSGALDGNGDGCVDSNDPSRLEDYNAWHHLFLAGMVKGPFEAISSPPMAEREGIAYRTALDNIFMHFSCADASYYSSFDRVGITYLTLYRSTISMVATDYIFNAIVWTIGGYGPGLWPSQARYIDDKLDDGLPLTGKVRSVTPGIADNERGSCPFSDGTNQYNTDEKATWGNCGLWIHLAW